MRRKNTSLSRSFPTPHYRLCSKTMEVGFEGKYHFRYFHNGDVSCCLESRSPSPVRYAVHRLRRFCSKSTSRVRTTFCFDGQKRRHHPRPHLARPATKYPRLCYRHIHAFLTEIQSPEKILILKTTLDCNSAVNNHNIISIAKGYFGIVDKPPKQNFPLSLNNVISIKMMRSAFIVKI